VNDAEPCHDIAHLAHVELLTPKPDESLRFFLDVMGMQESARAGDSVYLRGWDDYEHHTLKLTASKKPGIGHFAFRATSPAALQRRAEALQATGLGIGWTDGDVGHGPAYLCRDPDGHAIEIYYETEWYKSTAALKPALKNQAARYSANGIGVRRLDHLNLLANDIKGMRAFLEGAVGLRTTEMIVLDSGLEEGIWLTATNKSYDIAYTRDHTGAKGRFHHITYAVDSRELVLRAADICLEHGVPIETGPHKHAVQQTFFLYLFEPGGNRVEVCNAGARLILAPDWKPIVWSEAERAKGQAWGLKRISTFHTYGTPDIEPENALDSHPKP
jgi:catechol 2,3-dioxygenase